MPANFGTASSRGSADAAGPRPVSSPAFRQRDLGVARGRGRPPHYSRLLAAGVFLCLAAGAARAVDFAALKPEGYVSDFARVIDAGSRGQLERYCAALEKATGVQMALVTLPSLAGEPVEDVANSLFRKWGIGQKGKDNGVLLLLSIQDRRSRLEVGYGLEPIITDGDAGDVLRAMRPYLRQERYGDALLQAANEIGTRITNERHVSLQPPAPQQPPPQTHEGPIPFALILGGLILFAVLARLGRGGRGGRRGGFGGGPGGFLIGMLLGNLMGRSIGYRSGGGGFGGYDSGDSFGGFGGGDSGGGGASSSW